ncbi:MAG TPA: 3-oxoacyl-ACP reductase family protein [Bryobacteraceae bacterium]|nr:3-oxoacyl-ACP reductase family protein [Bryobacteraceae bacterium]
MDSLDGRVALVTGGSRGLGRAIAIGLAQAGADVAVNHRARAGEAGEVVESIRSLGRRAVAVQADVALGDDVRRLIESSGAALGAITILVNNAGIARPQGIDEITEKDWDDLIDTNLKSCFLVTQAALPVMRARHWGRIVNISSVAAHVGGVVGPHYAASKAGMIGLTHSYAHLLVKEGITANAISPALIDTDMVRANLNAKPDRIPVGRFGHVDEVAEVVVMLARNGYITGQTIHVNGGWYMS